MRDGSLRVVSLVVSWPAGARQGISREVRCADHRPQEERVLGSVPRHVTWARDVVGRRWGLSAPREAVVRPFAACPVRGLGDILRPVLHRNGVASSEAIEATRQCYLRWTVPPPANALPLSRREAPLARGGKNAQMTRD